jgi:hypothetical protein
MTTVNKVIKSKPNYFRILHGESVVRKCECALSTVSDLSRYIRSVSVDSLHIFEVQWRTGGGGQNPPRNSEVLTQSNRIAN